MLFLIYASITISVIIGYIFYCGIADIEFYDAFMFGLLVVLIVAPLWPVVLPFIAIYHLGKYCRDYINKGY